MILNLVSTDLGTNCGFNFTKSGVEKSRKNIFVQVERHLLKDNAQHTKNIPKLPIFRAFFF